jgi:lipid II:glycine glycyltransferase (peptidoglycan interpeptide bridge formation enzyme)
MVSSQTAMADREPILNPQGIDSGWQVEVDRATPAEWSRMLDLFDDANIYQTWSYGAIRWARQNLSHLVLKQNDEVLAAAQLRIVRPTRFNFGMAYLRWGPLCHRRGTELGHEILRRMARSLEEEYVGKRKLFLKVLPNAFAGSPRAALFQSAFSRFTQEPCTPANVYRTFVLDLAPPLEELRRNLDKKWRNQLTRSEKNGLTVVSSTGTDEYRRFCGMYKQMRERKSFESLVDIEEFARIQEDLPDTQRMQVMICEQAGVPVAGIVSSGIGDSAIYLLGATSDNGLNAKGAYLLQWTLIQWLKKNGFKWYDLGGIDPVRNLGVYHFKSGLSGTDVAQLTPLTACNNVIFAAIVRGGQAAQRALRSVATLHLGRANKSTG